MAAQHLIEEHGHKCVAFLSLNKRLYTLKVRYEGYQRAMQEASLRPLASFKCNSQESTSAEIHSMLSGERPPTALLCANNLTMRYTLRALLDADVKIPETVALAGFDDFELAEVLHPTLTVVRQPADELGTVAADLLFARLGGESSPKTGRDVVLPVELVVRRSCGCR